jgi:hypothetical protein
MEQLLMDLAPAPAPARATRFHAIPFSPTPERASVVSQVLRGIASFDGVIMSDQVGACSEHCFECPACVQALQLVSAILAAPDTACWEIWSEEGDEAAQLVGVVYLTRTRPGVDAVAHFCFFDRELRNKTALLRELTHWWLSDHEGWLALERVTLEIPDYAFRLARYTQRKLGFSGAFVYRLNGKTVRVEGVRRDAIRWRGLKRSVLLLGLLREEGV